jgi:hypothetical protein
MPLSDFKDDGVSIAADAAIATERFVVESCMSKTSAAALAEDLSSGRFLLPSSSSLGVAAV